MNTFTTHVACQLALNGIGIALIDSLTAMDSLEPDLKLCRFEPETGFDICIMTPRQWPLSWISQKLIDHLLDAATETEREMAQLLV